MQERKGDPRDQRRGGHILPTGNTPEQLALSAEGRRVLKKAIVRNMTPVWSRIAKLPDEEVVRAGNSILKMEVPRRQLVEMHENSLKLREDLKDRLPPQISDFEL